MGSRSGTHCLHSSLGFAVEVRVPAVDPRAERGGEAGREVMQTLGESLEHLVAALLCRELHHVGLGVGGELRDGGLLLLDAVVQRGVVLLEGLLDVLLGVLDLLVHCGDDLGQVLVHVQVLHRLGPDANAGNLLGLVDHVEGLVSLVLEAGSDGALSDGRLSSGLGLCSEKCVELALGHFGVRVDDFGADGVHILHVLAQDAKLASRLVLLLGRGPGGTGAADHCLCLGIVGGKPSAHLVETQVQGNLGHGVLVGVVKVGNNAGEILVLQHGDVGRCHLGSHGAGHTNERRTGLRLGLPARIEHDGSPGVGGNAVLPLLLHPNGSAMLALEPRVSLHQLLHDGTGPQTNGDVEGKRLGRDVQLGQAPDLHEGRRVGSHVRLKHHHGTLDVDFGHTPEVRGALNVELGLAEAIKAPENSSVTLLVDKVGADDLLAEANVVGLEEELKTDSRGGSELNVDEDTIPATQGEVPGSLSHVLDADGGLHATTVDVDTIIVLTADGRNADAHLRVGVVRGMSLPGVADLNAEHAEGVLDTEGSGRRRLWLFLETQAAADVEDMQLLAAHSSLETHVSLVHLHVAPVRRVLFGLLGLHGVAHLGPRSLQQLVGPSQHVIPGNQLVRRHGLLDVGGLAPTGLDLGSVLAALGAENPRVLDTESVQSFIIVVIGEPVVWGDVLEGGLQHIAEGTTVVAGSVAQSDDGSNEAVQLEVQGQSAEHVVLDQLASVEGDGRSLLHARRGPLVSVALQTASLGVGRLLLRALERCGALLLGRGCHCLASLGEFLVLVVVVLVLRASVAPGALHSLESAELGVNLGKRFQALVLPSIEDLDHLSARVHVVSDSVVEVVVLAVDRVDGAADFTSPGAIVGVGEGLGPVVILAAVRDLGFDSLRAACLHAVRNAGLHRSIDNLLELVEQIQTFTTVLSAGRSAGPGCAGHESRAASRVVPPLLRQCHGGGLGHITNGGELARNATESGSREVLVLRTNGLALDDDGLPVVHGLGHHSVGSLLVLSSGQRRGKRRVGTLEAVVSDVEIVSLVEEVDSLIVEVLVLVLLRPGHGGGRSRLELLEHLGAGVANTLVDGVRHLTPGGHEITGHDGRVGPRGGVGVANGDQSAELLLSRRGERGIVQRPAAAGGDAVPVRRSARLESLCLLDVNPRNTVDHRAGAVLHHGAGLLGHFVLLGLLPLGLEGSNERLGNRRHLVAGGLEVRDSRGERIDVRGLNGLLGRGRGTGRVIGGLGVLHDSVQHSLALRVGLDVPDVLQHPEGPEVLLSDLIQARRVAFEAHAALPQLLESHLRRVEAQDALGLGVGGLAETVLIHLFGLLGEGPDGGRSEPANVALGNGSITTSAAAGEHASLGHRVGLAVVLLVSDCVEDRVRRDPFHVGQERNLGLDGHAIVILVREGRGVGCKVGCEHSLGVRLERGECAALDADLHLHVGQGSGGSVDLLGVARLEEASNMGSSFLCRGTRVRKCEHQRNTATAALRANLRGDILQHVHGLVATHVGRSELVGDTLEVGTSVGVVAQESTEGHDRGVAHAVLRVLAEGDVGHTVEKKLRHVQIGTLGATKSQRDSGLGAQVVVSILVPQCLEKFRSSRMTTDRGQSTEDRLHAEKGEVALVVASPGFLASLTDNRGAQVLAKVGRVEVAGVQKLHHVVEALFVIGTSVLLVLHHVVLRLDELQRSGHAAVEALAHHLLEVLEKHRGSALGVQDGLALALHLVVHLELGAAWVGCEHTRLVLHVDRGHRADLGGGLLIRLDH
mmetsp:Transcript_2631/g.6245  ORF Transcript_2631/g.6245 Transcript_2631/m.6245 type:complete len:1756 (+) Transcript_2631:2070-7337(+)